jgi:RNA polymerase sigma-70 factor, ECF subfamily
VVEELSLAYPKIEAAAAELDLPALVAEYSPLLFRVAYSVLRNAAEAEDAVQDAFVRVLEHRRSIMDVRDPRAWLVRIAWNLALDRRRRVKPAQMDDLQAAALASPGVSADLALSQARETAAVLRAIDRLPEPERQALLLTTLEELTTPEVASIMGRSESGVRALVFRARARLRERLGKAGQS